MEQKNPHLDNDPLTLLREALQNPTYQRLAEPNTPLGIDELTRSEVGVTHSSEFQTLINVVGWPSQSEDDALIPRHEYASDEEFAYYLAEAPMEDEFFLNNFNAYLTARRTTITEDGLAHTDTDHLRSIIDVNYGSAPVLQRMYLVAPDLMQALHDSLGPLGDGELGSYITAHPDIAKAAHLTYKLMGRLVKPTDMATHLRLVYGLQDEVPPITDVHKSLIT